MKAKLKKIVVHSKNINTFWLKPPEYYSFIAGQFAEISIATEDGDLISRELTISSAPSSPLIAFTTKFTLPYSDFKIRLQELKPGADIFVSEPIGDFILPKNKSKPLVFIAGGIGITPFLSIVTELKANQESRSITLLYCVRSKVDLLFIKKLSWRGVKVIPIIAPNTNLMTAQVTKMLPSNSLVSSLFYIAGSENFTNKVAKNLQSANVKKRQIVTDIFLGY